MGQKTTPGVKGAARSGFPSERTTAFGAKHGWAERFSWHHMPLARLHGPALLTARPPLRPGRPMAPRTEHLLHEGTRGAGHSPTAAADAHTPPAQGALTLAAHRLPVHGSHARGAGSGGRPRWVCEEDMPPVSPMRDTKYWQLWGLHLPHWGQRADAPSCIRCTTRSSGKPTTRYSTGTHFPRDRSQAPSEHVTGWCL